MFENGYWWPILNVSTFFFFSSFVMCYLYSHLSQVPFFLQFHLDNFASVTIKTKPVLFGQNLFSAFFFFMSSLTINTCFVLPCLHCISLCIRISYQRSALTYCRTTLPTMLLFCHWRGSMVERNQSFPKVRHTFVDTCYLKSWQRKSTSSSL